MAATSYGLFDLPTVGIASRYGAEDESSEELPVRTSF